MAVLRYHHTPDQAGAKAGQPCISLINLAEKLLPSFGIAENVGAGADTQNWLALGIAPDRANELTAAVHAQAKQAKQLAASF